MRASLRPGGPYAKEKEEAARQVTESMTALLDDMLAAALRHPAGYEELARAKSLELGDLDMKTADAAVRKFTEFSNDPALGGDARALLKEYADIFGSMEKYLPKGA